MKKYLSFFLIVLSLSITCMAQEHTTAKISNKNKNSLLITIGAGYTLNNVTGSMVDHNQYWNDQARLGKLQMRNKGGFIISGMIQQYFPGNIYIKSGLSYIQRQIDPEYNSIDLYKDHLSTGYLSVPILIGISALPEETKSLNFSVEFGPSVNVRVIDNSRSGPDRSGFKTAATTISLCPGAELSYATDDALKIVLRYTYMFDLSNSYTESLYYGPTDPSHALYYKWRTSIFSLGLKWAL